VHAIAFTCHPHQRAHSTVHAEYRRCAGAGVPMLGGTAQFSSFHKGTPPRVHHQQSRVDQVHKYTHRLQAVLHVRKACLAASTPTERERAVMRMQWSCEVNGPHHSRPPRGGPRPLQDLGERERGEPDSRE